MEVSRASLPCYPNRRFILQTRKCDSNCLYHIPFGDPRWPQVNPQGRKEKECRESQEYLITLINFKVKVGFIAL